MHLIATYICLEDSSFSFYSRKNLEGNFSPSKEHQIIAQYGSKPYIDTISSDPHFNVKFRVSQTIILMLREFSGMT